MGKGLPAFLYLRLFNPSLGKVCRGLQLTLSYLAAENECAWAGETWGWECGVDAGHAHLCAFSWELSFPLYEYEWID
jgi:hypothetical protein